MPDPTYEDVYEPPMLDSTGQAILQAIQALSAPSGTDVAISPTGMHIVTEDDVQGAISELDSAVDSVNASLTQLLTPYFMFNNLGYIANLNLTVSSADQGKASIGTYTSSSSNIPQANSGGFCITFINVDSYNYGRQIAVSNGGIWTRPRSGGSWGTWTAIA